MSERQFTISEEVTTEARVDHSENVANLYEASRQLIGDEPLSEDMFCTLVLDYIDPQGVTRDVLPGLKQVIEPAIASREIIARLLQTLQTDPQKHIEYLLLLAEFYATSYLLNPHYHYDQNKYIVNENDVILYQMFGKTEAIGRNREPIVEAGIGLSHLETLVSAPSNVKFIFFNSNYLSWLIGQALGRRLGWNDQHALPNNTNIEIEKLSLAHVRYPSRDEKRMLPLLQGIVAKLQLGGRCVVTDRFPNAVECERYKRKLELLLPDNFRYHDPLFGDPTGKLGILIGRKAGSPLGQGVRIVESA